MLNMIEGSNIHLSPVDGKRLCSYSQKICKQHRLNGFAFCIRHILEDTNAPFKQCQYKMKSSGEQCCNAVPVSQERIYCISHLQVLGLAPKTVPKKFLKKEISSITVTSSKSGGKNLKTTSNKIMKKIKSQKMQKKKRAQILLMNKKMKKKTISKITEQKSQATKNKMKNEFWQTNLEDDLKTISEKNKKWNLKKLPENLESYKKSQRVKSEDHIIGIHRISSDNSDSESEESKYIYQSQLLITPERAYHNDLHTDNVITQEKKVLSKLRHQYAQMKQTFVAKKSRPDLSYSALKHLISAAKHDPLETANIINTCANPDTCTVKRDNSKKFSYKVPCCIQNKKSRCSNNALPYTRYCVKHILRDEEQLIYFKPSPVNIKTPTQVYGVTYTFLCNATPPKKLNPPKDLKSFEGKRKNSKHSEDSEQSSFNESSERTNSDYTTDTDDTSDDDDDDETPEEAFHLAPGTLSAYPGINQIDEDSLSALQSRNIDFEDDEDEELMRCSSKTFDKVKPRDLSSPTLNQLSASNFENSLFSSQGNKSSNRSSLTNPMTSYRYAESFLQDNNQTVNKSVDETLSNTNTKIIDTPIEKVNPDIFFSSAYPVSTKDDTGTQPP